MRERGLDPDFPPRALDQLHNLRPPPAPPGGAARDLRSYIWCSIDNDDSRDLDQLTYSEARPGGAVRLLVAVADVDILVREHTALDDHARKNTTSVYTVAQIFPMLPERLSTDLTSLAFESDRRAMVVEIHFAADGSLQDSEIYQAWVRNRAKLTYNSVGAWLEDGGAAPPEIAAVPGLAENLRRQDRLAQLLRARRVQQGALGLETVETRAVFDGPELKGLQVEKRNRAKDLIEDFMIAANGATARYLAGKGSPSLRRVVRTPRRWGRIAELAAERGTALPATPDARALERFLVRAKAADPVRFPDLSLLIVKLMGSGEYVLELPGQTAPGHFGLALKDYSHSTAPNRRFPDLITQRLRKAAGAGRLPPYRNEELAALARHCTETEDAVTKLERQVAKCAAALLLESHIGEEFDAIITAVAKGGTWLRLFHPPTEGKLVEGYQGKDAGQRIRVRLVATDAERGHIDLAAVE